MEADLGIDSIKRVEILGKLRDEFPGLSDLTESTETMDALTQARTLGAIVDRMVGAGGPGPAPVAPTAEGIVRKDRDGGRRLLAEQTVKQIDGLNRTPNGARSRAPTAMADTKARRCAG